MFPKHQDDSMKEGDR